MAMRCERARELILTDHMDGELGAEERQKMEEHLRTCAGCNKLEKLVREKSIRPFAAAVKEEPPAYLWESIREKIALSEADVRTGIFSNAADGIRRIFSYILRIPKPVMAFAAAVTVIVAILTVTSISQDRALNEYLNEQASFLARLDVTQVNGASIFDTDIRTGVENIL